MNNFLNRLVYEKEQKQEEVDKIQKMLLNFPFKPRISRPPKNRKIGNITEYLYENRKEREAIKKLVDLKQELLARRKATTTHISEKSQNIVSSLRQKELKRVFEELDVNKTGIVNIGDLKQEWIVNTIKEKLKDDPFSIVIDVLQKEMEKKINFTEFVQIMETKLV